MVVDKDRPDSPIAGVRVTVVETGQEVRTSPEGSFLVADLRPGAYTLALSKDGFSRKFESVVVEPGKLAQIRVALAGDYTELEPFVVQDALNLGTGSEAALLQLRFESPALLDSISADLISRAGASDAAGALRLVSGATVQDGKFAVIRGLPDRYVSSQLNGVRLPSADNDTRAVELDQFPSAAIESIQVSKTFTPDQQGDASGGAVNVLLKGVPDEPFFLRVRGQVGYNSQVRGRDDFLTYGGGGVNTWGKDDGRRDQQLDNLGGNWDGEVGVSRDEAPDIYKWSVATGGSYEFGDGFRVGGFSSFFYDRDAEFFNNGIDDTYWVEAPGAPMTPRAFQGSVQDGDFRTALFDVTRGVESVQFGTLSTVGIASETQSIGLTYFYTRTVEDTTTLAVDTRSKEFFFPGYDPNDPTTPGHEQDLAAPYLTLETLAYNERTADSLQLAGRHEIPVGKRSFLRSPEFDWVVSRSKASSDTPDKRQFGSIWTPDRPVGGIVIPATHRVFKPAANFTLGNLQRIWERISEESEQYSLNLKVPFEQWTADEGYLKFGLFRDEVTRRFDQDTFSNFNDNSFYEGSFDDPWSRRFRFEQHPITESNFDVDYDGEQQIKAWYVMADIPLWSELKLVGGVRYEDTGISVINNPESEAFWFPPGSLAQTQLNPGDADVDYGEDALLPALALEYRPFTEWTLRAAYSETIARQTFKELTPILQQEFLGGPIFIGNPELRQSKLKNYDLRVDYTPFEGSLFSVSWFQKDVTDAIEVVQRIAAFNFDTAVNYPEGELQGFEFEARQELGDLWEPLAGLSLGGNATLIDSEVTLPEEDRVRLELPNIQAPMPTRDMTNAPEYLYNLYLSYDAPWGEGNWGSQLTVFYSVQGDTLIAGAGEADGNFVPNVYAEEFGTLNVSVDQALGEWFRLRFQAKNLTNPDINTVYRSPYIGPDVLKTSFTRGIDYSLSLGAEVRF